MKNFNLISIIICFDLQIPITGEKSYLMRLNGILLVLPVEGPARHSFFWLQYIQAPEVKQRYELVFDL